MRQRGSASARDGEAAALWGEVRRRSEAALRSGALVPLVTERHVVLARDVPFLVHLLSGGGLLPRGAARRPDDAQRDPFLPYDEGLFVAELSDSHVALLNKFTVLDDHLLVVTRAFEEQESRLELADFRALELCLAGSDGLGFYNSGPVAGASQRHRHLQVVPRPPGGPDPFPLTSRVEQQLSAGRDSARRRLLPFRHALGIPESGSLWRDADEMVAAYRRLLAELDLVSAPGGLVPEPYNLLVTAGSMLLVPRRRERWRGISVNALGFAGSLLAPSEAALVAIRRAGPYHVLGRVGG